MQVRNARRLKGSALVTFFVSLYAIIQVHCGKVTHHNELKSKIIHSFENRIIPGVFLSAFGRSADRADEASFLVDHGIGMTVLAGMSALNLGTIGNIFS